VTNAGVGVATALLALTACAPRRDFVRVGRVEVAGAHAVSQDAIIDGLATRGPSGLVFKEYVEYDEVSVAADWDRIESYYQSEGYFSARVLEAKTQKRPDGSMAVTFAVEEGEPTRIRAVELGGLPPKGPGATPPRGVVRLAEGDVYKQAAYLETKARLGQVLVGEGYAHAEVDGTV
jgi:outer membrane protein assembly factor BamA